MSLCGATQIGAGSCGLHSRKLYQRSTAFRATMSRPRTVVVRANLGEMIGGLAKKFDLNEGKKQFTINQAGSYDELEVKSKVEKLIADNQVMVFSWSGCPFCKKAKAALSEMGAQYTALELDTIPDGKAIRAELTKMTNRTSVPNIFIGGKNIGGCNDGPGLLTLENKGELKPMLQAVGAL